MNLKYFFENIHQRLWKFVFVDVPHLASIFFGYLSKWCILQLSPQPHRLVVPVLQSRGYYNVEAFGGKMKIVMSNHWNLSIVSVIKTHAVYQHSCKTLEGFG